MESITEHWIPETNFKLLMKLYNMMGDPESTAVAAIAIYRMKEWRELDRVDGLMVSADITQLHAGAILAVLRGTYSIKDELPHWRQFRDDVRKELESRELDAAKFMVGLLS